MQTAVGFDPTKIPVLLQDLQDLGKDFPLLVKTVTDLVGLFKSGAGPFMSRPPVKCGTVGEQDVGCCCQAAVEKQLEALALCIQACRCSSTPPAA